MSLKKIWNSAITSIKREITPVSFNTFISTMEPLKIIENQVIFLVQNDFIKGIIEGRYLDIINSSINNVSGQQYIVKLVTSKDEIKEEQKKVTKKKAKESIIPNSNLNPKYTFDSFVIGNSNRFSHAACVAVAEAPAKSYNPLFLYGGVGLGKTHLMQAIGHHILKYNEDSTIVYVSSEKFTNELINSIKDDKNEEFRNKYRNVDVLLIDDIQFIAGKERTQEEFFHTFNALHEANKQIIISSDRTPKEIPTLEDRLRTRFEMGLITDIQPPDFETRVAILRKKAQVENIDIKNEVMNYIAKNIKSNIRELEGALTRVIAYSSLTNKPVNVDLAKEALKDIVRPNRPTEVNADLIKEFVAREFNIKMSDFASKKRTRAIAYPRQIAMYICRELTDMSLPKIGDAFGGRDHSTVIHAHEKIASDITKDQNFKKRIINLISDIRNLN